MQWISPKALEKAQSESKDYLILDVREEYEHQICSIPCLSIPMADIAVKQNEIPKDKKIVVMCRSGKRAEAVANLMECELGFDELLVLEGGILNWIEQIAPNLESY